MPSHPRPVWQWQARPPHSHGARSGRGPPRFFCCRGIEACQDGCEEAFGVCLEPGFLMISSVVFLLFGAFCTSRPHL